LPPKKTNNAVVFVIDLCTALRFYW